MAHISYSELKIWAECPFKHKLMYIDKIKGFIGNEYTAFGGAIHSLCENAVVGSLEEEDFEEFFQMNFRDELKKIDVTKPSLVMQMLEQRHGVAGTQQELAWLEGEADDWLNPTSSPAEDNERRM